MKTSLQWVGLDKMAANAKRIIRRMDQAAGRGAKSGADAIAGEARSRAPVRTGRLKASIYSRRDDGAKTAAVAGVDTGKAPYAPFVEFGSSHASAQPFMRPAVRAGKAEAAKAIAEECREALE